MCKQIAREALGLRAKHFENLCCKTLMIMSERSMIKVASPKVNNFPHRFNSDSSSNITLNVFFISQHFMRIRIATLGDHKKSRASKSYQK